jgi:two-component system response regulator HydG
MAQSERLGPKILLVEDDASLRLTQSLYLKRAGFRVSGAEVRTEARGLLEAQAFDVVVTDLRLRDEDGLDVLRDTRQLQPGAQVLLITGYGSVETAVLAMKEGAYDYLTKPVDPEELVQVIHGALDRTRLRDSMDVEALCRAPAGDRGPDHVVAESPAMRDVLATVQQVAPSDATVLIEGESGTGKDLLARLIHRHSRRADGPYLGINCGAMPENLLEAELFGHVRGAYTGAHKDHKGLFETAHGGTLFLDEIGETGEGFQVKLLRALQERRIRRLGDNREIEVDVRIIAASNKSLAQLVMQGRFRRDLFFRVKVVPIHLPPLRERPEDILPIAERYLQVLGERGERQPPRLSEEARRKLLAYDWPGNVRELENALERALIFNKGKVVEARDLMLETGLCEPAAACNGPETHPMASLEEMEKRHIQAVLEQCGGNKAETARVLEIGYNTLWRKLKKYGINLSEA